MIKDLNCGPVDMHADKVDNGESESFAYKISIKICLPGDEKTANKLNRAVIKFKTQSDTTLQLYDSKGKTIREVAIDSQSIRVGYQGKFSLMIVPQSIGIRIKIMTDVALYRRPNNQTRFRRSQVIINGRESNSFETNIE